MESERDRGGGMIVKHYTRGGGLEVKLRSQVWVEVIFSKTNTLIMLVEMDLQLSVSAHPQVCH